MNIDKKNKSKINYSKIQKILNLVSITSIFLVSILTVLIFMIGYFQLKRENISLVKEKKEHIFKLYIGNIFQRLLLLSNSTPFLDYLRSGDVSRNELESEMLNNFSDYINDEITGYKVVDLSYKQIISVGKNDETFLMLDLCYINDRLDVKIGRCIAKLYVFFDKDRVFKKIQEIDPSVAKCSDCSYFKINSGTSINGFEVIKSSNFIIPFTVQIDNYSKTIIFIIFSLFIMIIASASSFYLNRMLLDKYICHPLTKLFGYVKNGSERGPFILEEVSDIADNIDQLKNEIRKTEQTKQHTELTKLAQVAHDIRSPLIALNAFLAKSSQLPEDNRIMARNAIQRIQDIANGLILKHQEIIQKNLTSNTSKADEAYSIQLLSSLIDSLVSEKRMQYRDQLGIEILGDISVESYGLFSNIQSQAFKRILSNLINNAVESLDERGIVKVSLNFHNSQISLKVIDNGKGIHPEILPKLMKRGATFNKPGGTGLGLYHAKSTAELWGGKLEIYSKPNEGSTVTLILPKSQAPSWFISCLTIQRNSTVVIIDDDTSIHNIWKERFQGLVNSNDYIFFIHFSNPNDVISWHQKQNFYTHKKIYYLCDFEFVNHKFNGIELISKLNIQKESILVTSRFEEVSFRENCERLKIKMIPKSLTYYIPIKIIDTKEKPDAILIDDDLFVHSIWKMTTKNKSVVYYDNPKDFFNNIEKYDLCTPLYIDSNLGDEIKGEDVAKKIFELGFEEIYLATGYPPEYFPKMPWIKKILSKDPPWIS